MKITDLRVASSGRSRAEDTLRHNLSLSTLDASSGRVRHGQELSRSLGIADLLAYGLVCISPLAAVAIFGVVFNVSHGTVPLVYLVGLVAMMFTALSYMTMSAAFPVAGSVYTYATQSLGATAGFLGGWAILLDYLLGPVLTYVVCAIAIHAAVPSIPKPLFVIFMVVVVTAINYLGIKTAARASLLLLAFQLMIVALFVAFAIIGILHHVDHAEFSLTPFYGEQGLQPGVIFAGLSLATISFIGFDGISTLAEESRDGPLAVGRAIMLCLLVTAFLFVLQTWLASLFLPGHTSLPQGAATDAAFYDIAERVGGYTFKFLLAVPGVIFAGTAAIVTSQAAAARVIFGMARDRKLPHALAHVDPIRRVPIRSTLLVSSVTLIAALLLVDRLALLTSLVSFGALVGFLFVHISVIAHFAWRRSSRYWWRHFVVPAIGVVIVGYILWNTAKSAKIAGISWLAVGLALYLATRVLRRRADTRSMRG